MGEPVELVEKESLKGLPSMDPRDYFRLTQFQKLGALVASSNEGYWGQVIFDSFYMSCQSGVIAAGTTYDNRTDTYGIIFVCKESSQAPFEVYIPHLNQERRNFIIEYLNEFVPSLPGNRRIKYSKGVIEIYLENPNLSIEDMAFKLGNEVLGYVDDQLNLNKQVSDIESVVSLLPPDDAKKKKQIYDFLLVFARKMAPEDFKDCVKRFIDRIQMEDGVWTQNFKFFPDRVLKWLFQSRGDLERDDRSLERPGLAKYPVQDKIKIPIQGEENLGEVLATLRVKAEPDVRSFSKGITKAKFVPLEKVMGGAGIKDWRIIGTNERGIKRILYFAELYQEGRYDPRKEQSEAIKAFEYKGEFYIIAGRHRVAALKALGASEIPMLVVEIITN